MITHLRPNGHIRTRLFRKRRVRFSVEWVGLYLKVETETTVERILGEGRGSILLRDPTIALVTDV
jgi:hypothetical protein